MVCLNVIEHVDDDVGALRNIRSVLSPRADARSCSSRSGPWNFGTLDEVLGHKRRYTEAALRRVAAEAGLEVKQIIRFNRVSSLPWFLNGRVLRKTQLRARSRSASSTGSPPSPGSIDRFLPFPPLSLIAVMERRPD